MERLKLGSIIVQDTQYWG